VDIALDILAGLCGLALGLWAGWRLVKRYGRSRRWFWALNGTSLAACVGLCALAGAAGALWLVIASLALLLGLLTGLKYGWHGGLPRSAEVRRESA